MHLYANGMSQSVIADSIINDGSLIWSIASTLPSGDNLKIRVVSHSDSVDAYSEPFTLVAVPTLEPTRAPPTPARPSSPIAAPRPTSEAVRHQTGNGAIVVNPVIYISGGIACAVAGVAVFAWRVLRRTRPYSGLVQADEVQLAVGVTELAPLATKHDPAAPEIVVEGTIEEIGGRGGD